MADTSMAGGAQRQNKVLIYGGIAVAVMLLWAFVWDPLSNSRQALRQQLSEHQSTALWLEQIRPQVLGRAPASNRLPQDRSLLRLADETLRAAGMAAAIERIEPGDQGQVRIWLRDASFDQLAGWLVQIANQYSVFAEQLNASRAGDSGLVNVRLEITAG